MIVLQDATDFISQYEKIHGIKVYRIPFTAKTGERKALLMCKKRGKWVSLPYMSVGVMEEKIIDRHSAPFQIFENEESNYISSSRAPWEVRDIFAHSQYLYTDKVLTTLNIEKVDNVWDLFSQHVINKINESIKYKVEITCGKSKKYINKFYEVYKKRMLEMDSAFISKRSVTRRVKNGLTTIFLAERNGEVIGGATLNTYEDGLFTNEWFSTLEEHNHYYPSYLLHYAMLRYAKENGGKIYSLGRSTRDSGVHKYKKHWNGEETTLFFSYSKKVKDIRQNQFYKKLWKHVPLFVKKIVSPLIAHIAY